MNISKKDFQKYSLNQRINALEILGVYIANRFENNSSILLYGLQELYIEVRHTTSGNVVSAKIISDEEAIDLYVGDVMFEIRALLQ
jgi:hypothetical protein